MDFIEKCTETDRGIFHGFADSVGFAFRSSTSPIVDRVHGGMEVEADRSIQTRTAVIHPCVCVTSI